MSESVKILIEADDQASQKIAAAAKNVEASVKNIKTTGEQAKKSTEFFGSIANALGGSELAGYASQLAGITEKTSQFAEVSKMGGAGAIAFKAGLVGVVGVLSFNIGKALGDVLFQTSKWNDELAKAATKAEKLDASLAKIKDYKFSMQKEEISLMRDPDEQIAATKELIAAIENEIKTGSERINGILASEAKKLAEDEQWGDDVLGFNSARVAAVAKEVAGIDKVNDALREKRDELNKTISVERQRLDALKAENALKDKSEAYLKGLKEELDLLNAIKQSKGSGAIETAAIKNTAGADEAIEAQKLLGQIERAKEFNAKRDSSDAFIQGLRDEVMLLKSKKEELAGIEAFKKTVGSEAFSEAKALLEERDALVAKRDLERQAEAEKKAALERIADLKQNELDKLEQERIELTKGKEAAAAFALEKQGLSKADAANIAKQQTELEAKKALSQKKTEAPPELKAFESRLLTRGSGQDPSVQIASNTAMAAAALKAIQAMQQDERRERAIRLKVMK